MALFQSLTYRPFALLWAGQTLSRVGDHLYEVALAWWVLQKTGSAAAMGLVLICALSPMLLFLLLGGVAVDRWPRVRLMFLSDLGRGVIVAGVAALAFSDQLEIWHIYVASLFFGFVDAFFQPAYAATVPDMAPEHALPSANALTSLSTQTGRIAGPALGAAIVAAGGTPTAFAINAVSFFLSAALLAPLLGWVAPPAAATESSEAPHSILGDLRQAARTVFSTPVLWIAILTYSLSNITLAGTYSVAMPFLVQEHLHGDVGTLGFLYAVFPVGYVLGSIWLGRRARIRHRGWLIFGGLIVAGLMLGALGLPSALSGLVLAGMAAAALINGAALEAGGLAWTSTMQEVVPREELGRVSSMDMLGSFGLLPVGYAVTGLLVDAWGPATVFLVGGGLSALLGALALLHPQARGLD